MKQKPIYTWFKNDAQGLDILGKEQRQHDLVYFYCEWINGKRPVKCGWVSQMPEAYTFKKEIYLRGLKTNIILVGLFDIYKKNEGRQYPFRDYFHFKAEDGNPEYKSIPLLKSHLQKCIRRGLDDLAVISAYHLMRLDLLQFLRRFSIIMLEDSSCHDSLNVLVWFMCRCQNGDTYKWLSQEMVYYFLGIVLWTSRNRKYDRYIISNNQDFTGEKGTLRQNLTQLENSILRNVCLSLYLRSEYGGLKGDMRMIHRFLAKINDANGNKLVNHWASKTSLVQAVRRLKLDEIVLAALDFHVYPGIIRLIVKEHSQYSEEEIKKAIWEGSSSLNVRLKIKDGRNHHSLVIWNNISDTYYKITKNLLRKIY